jgi:F-type H+-transporting ATPase subunit b
MNRLTAEATRLAGDLLQVDFDTDDQGVTSADPLLPPWKEIVVQTAASAIIFWALWKFGWPAIKTFLANRTENIQNDLDGAAEAKSEAETQAQEIRTALGDIDGERERLFAEAEAQAEGILADGRARLDAEIAELHTRADAEIASAANRSGDELRADIGRYTTASIERVVADTLDDAAQQELIENFISQVGASNTGASA